MCIAFYISEENVAKQKFGEGTKYTIKTEGNFAN